MMKLPKPHFTLENAQRVVTQGCLHQKRTCTCWMHAALALWAEYAKLRAALIECKRHYDVLRVEAESDAAKTAAVAGMGVVLNALEGR